METINNLKVNFNFVKAVISYVIITVAVLLLAHFLAPTADINDMFFYLLALFSLSAIIVYLFFRGPETKTKNILLVLLAPIILGVISTILYLVVIGVYSAFGGYLGDMWGLFVIITFPIAIITGFINGIFLILTKNLYKT